MLPALFLCRGAWAGSPEAIVYNQTSRVPLPVPMVSDYQLTDWDGDGRIDLLTLPQGYSLILHRNVGTPDVPLFEDGWTSSKRILEFDKRLGRYFSLADFDEDGRRDIISFERHEGLHEIGKRKLSLHLFFNTGTPDQPNWNVVPARNSRGDVFQHSADVWMCPTIDAADWDGDGKVDLMVGAWQPTLFQPTHSVTGGYANPPDSWNPFVARFYFVRNISKDSQEPIFADPVMLTVAGRPLAGYGFAYPKAMDVDGDGRLDLIAGEHRPGLRWYRQVGLDESGTPQFEYAGMIGDEQDQPIKTILSIRVQPADLNGDGKPELVGAPYFAGGYALHRFDHQAEGHDLSVGWRHTGWLPMQGQRDTPVAGQLVVMLDPVDWDEDDDTDLLMGAEPGTPLLPRNIGDDQNRVFAVPERLKTVDGSPLECYSIEVGVGSAWGPTEYYCDRVTPRAADWDGDGTLDILSGSMGRRLVWFRGHKVDGELRFERPAAFRSTRTREELVAAPRVQPVVRDLDGDGAYDLVALDVMGNATIYRGDGSLLLSPYRQLRIKDKPIRPSPDSTSGGSGRTGLSMADWDGDGRTDLLVYKLPAGCSFYRRTAEEGFQFEAPRRLFGPFEGHCAGATPIDWNHDGILDLLMGGDGRRLAPIFQKTDASPGGPNVPCGHLWVVHGEDTEVPPGVRKPGK